MDSPPFIMDGTTIDGEVIRRAIGTLIGPAGGIVTPGDLAVTQQATPNMSVLVGTGQCWVQGASTATQGPYYSRNGTAATLAVPAADPTNPRLDQIVVQIQDAEYAGSGKLCQLLLIQGTPTAGAALNNLVGLGTFPPANSSALLLAYVLVPNGATSIVTADILQVPVYAGVGIGAWVPLTLATNWNALAGAFAPAYRLVGNVVQLSGGATNNTGGVSSSPFATFPTAIRPVATVYDNFAIPGGGSYAFSLTTAGTATVQGVTNGASFTMDGRSYRLV